MARKAGRVSASSRPRRAGMVTRWRAWRQHHSQSAADSLAKVLHQPMASLMTWLVIGIAIALPTGLWIVMDNLGQAVSRFESPVQLSLFLKDDINESGAMALQVKLADRSDVRTVVFLDRDQALAEFIERSRMGDLAAGLRDNPLPHLLLVTPERDQPDVVAALSGDLAALPEVQEALVDTAWLRRLEGLMNLGRRFVILLATLLVLAVVLVLGNTIRLAIESRRDEIVIIKLVGGSDAFVRRPLLYTGLWYGLGGGIAGALLVLSGTLFLSGPVNKLATAYDSAFSLTGLGLVDSLQLALLGAALGLIGAWTAVARHLTDIEPG